MKDNHRLQENGRFSAKRKTEAVLQLLRGEDLDLLSREYKVTAGKLSQWRDAFLAGGQAGLQSGTGDDRDQQIQQLQAKVGELTMARTYWNTKSKEWRVGPLYQRGGRSHECSLLDRYP